VERTSVVLGWAVLISEHGQLCVPHLPLDARYLLGGRCLFPRRLSLLRATGSNPLASSSDGGGIANEDESSTCWRAEEEALRRVDAWKICRVGLTSLHKAETVRNGSSRKAMGAGR
jgi:hypothetical protein